MEIHIVEAAVEEAIEGISFAYRLYIIIITLLSSGIAEVFLFKIPQIICARIIEFVRKGDV